MSAISAASRTPVSLASMIFLATIPPIGSSFRSAMLSERKARSNAELRFSISSGGRLLFASKTFNGILVPHTRHTARNSYQREPAVTINACHLLGSWACDLWARLSQSAASFSHAALSFGLVALAAIWRHSSASRRNLSDSESVIATEYYKAQVMTLSRKWQATKRRSSAWAPCRLASLKLETYSNKC
jgi:hypothetical protein